MALAAHVCTFYDSHLAPHFRAEELILDAAREGGAALVAISDQVAAEHAQLGEMVDALRQPMEQAAQLDLLDRFGTQLEVHVRSEERTLYEGVQQLLDEEALLALGAAMDRVRANA